MFKRFIRSSSLPKWDRNKVILAPLIAFRVTLVTRTWEVSSSKANSRSLKVSISDSPIYVEFLILLSMIRDLSALILSISELIASFGGSFELTCEDEYDYQSTSEN